MDEAYKHISSWIFGTVFSLVLALSCPLCTRAQVRADDIRADFESGSIGEVTDNGPNQIEMELRLDDLSGDLYGWYYFMVEKNALDQAVTFTITNPDGWMHDEHLPLLTYNKKTWERIEDVTVSGGDFIFTQTFTEDSAWIAQCFPYTFTEIMTYLEELAQSPFVSMDTLGQSVEGRDIPRVIIADTLDPVDLPRVVWVISRQHPMESPSTFLIEGMLNYLVYSTSEEAERLRKDLIFHVVPMVNVDGVADGLSRHNVNGVNLNRDWAYGPDHSDEEPEVRALHDAIDAWVNFGGEIDFFVDLHSCPDLMDFGFILTEEYTFWSYHANQKSFLEKLDGWDPWQHASDWRAIDESYGSGLSMMAMYRQHSIDAYSGENSWTRRKNGQYIRIEGLISEGPLWALAIHDYLFCVRHTDRIGREVEEYTAADSVYATVDDPDENHRSDVVEQVYVTVTNSAKPDTEIIWLTETGVDTGLFRNTEGLPLASGPPHSYDGIIQTNGGASLLVTYQDNDFAPERCWDRAGVGMDVGVEGGGEMAQPMRYGVIAGPVPNPTRAGCCLVYRLPDPRTSGVEANDFVRIFDLSGRLVRSLPASLDRFGNRTAIWDGSDDRGNPVSPGVYFLRAGSGGYTIGSKVVVLR